MDILNHLNPLETTLAETKLSQIGYKNKKTDMTKSVNGENLEPIIDHKVITTGHAKGILDDTSIDIERNPNT